MYPVATETDPVKILRGIAANSRIDDICSVVLDDKRFATWSGSSDPLFHHYGTGGLAEHTKEVVQLMLAAYATLVLDKRGVTLRELILSGIFHDAGKMWDYEQDAEGKWISTSHKRHIHHISRSALVWNSAVDKFPVYEPLRDRVLHNILAHHGRREWGSPVAPATRTAWVLHTCDALSARAHDGDNGFIEGHKK